VKSVVEKVEQLMSLATSPNEHEARNAALLAVQLIRKHRLVLSMPSAHAPGAPRARARSEPSRSEDGAGRSRTPSPAPSNARRSRSSGRGVKRVADPPERIVAPLGGECVECGARYRAEQAIYWFASGGGMHVKCYEEWSKRR
jgi:hypothetical protein